MVEILEAVLLNGGQAENIEFKAIVKDKREFEQARLELQDKYNKPVVFKTRTKLPGHWA